MGPQANRDRIILLLDDEETELRSASQILQGEAYLVVEADTYRSALLAFQTQPRIDLLIADISLPDGNGCELAVALLRQKPDLKVLFISGHVGAEVCRFYGLDITDMHFLSKPFDGEALILRVKRVLASNHTPKLMPKTRTA